MCGESLEHMTLSSQAENRSIVVVAGGPSVNLAAVRQIGMARALDRCKVIAVSDAVYPCWFADHLHSCDARWWNRHRGAPGFKGTKSALEPVLFEDVEVLKNTGVEGFDPAPGCIRSGSNSGYQAVHIAAKLGAKRIVVLGVDFTNDGARTHWFGRHDASMDRHSNVEQWRRLFRGLTDILQARGVEILNAGDNSTLQWLPRIDLDRLA